MRRNEDVYKRIYTRTLERKNQVSKINNLRTNVFPSQYIENDSYLDFSKSKKNLLPSDSSVIYLYEDVLNDKTLLDRKSIVQHTIYKLPDFITRTKVGILVFDETGLIDPDMVSAYVTDMNTLVFIVNKSTSSYISIIYLKGIYSYVRYNNNIDVPIPAAYKNSFVIWTKLDNTSSGAVDWIDPVFSNGQWRIPIRAQGKYSVVMLADNFKFYNIVPQTNSQYSYINFPEDIGYTDLNNVFLWKNRQVGFTQPIAHTPLYDGIKVEGVTRVSIMFNGTNAYATFGPSFSVYNDFTLHLKLKIDNFQDFSRIIQRGNSDGAGWCLRTFNGNRLIFQFDKYDAQKNITSQALTLGTWYDIIITAKNGAAPVMYVNSIAQPSTSVNQTVTVTSGNELAVGRAANTNSNYANFEVDFIRIYNRILNFSEILNAYNGIPPVNGMVNEWLFDQSDFGTTSIFDRRGSNNGVLFGGYNWKHGPDDTAGRLVGFSKRVEFTSKYTNLLHEYGKYKNYMNEYLAGTLPTFIKNYVPYVPDITMDTLNSVFQDRMVTAYKDYPNLLKEYLEETKSIKFTEYAISAINPGFTRISTATDTDINYSIVPADTPRYVRNTDPLKKGIIIEEAVSNKVPDPLFKNPVLMTDFEADNPSNWSATYYTQTQPTVQVSNNILRFTAFNNSNGSIRLNTPCFTIDKSLPLTVQFKIKYIKNTGTHELWGYGSASSESFGQQWLESYQFVSEVDPIDGFMYKEYRFPPNTFTGTGTTLSFGLWGGWNGYEEKDFYLKEFQVTNKSYGGLTFTTVDKSPDILMIASQNVLNPTTGSVEFWITPKSLPTTDSFRLMQTNDSDDNTRFLITIMPNGSVVFANAGTVTPSKYITSPFGMIAARNLYHIAMTWENKTLYAYINGIMVGTANVGVDANIKTYFYIGADSGGGRQINAIIHDFRVSNVRKTLSQIQATYTAKTSLSIEANTTMKLNFNETIVPPKELTHPVKLVTNHNLSKRLLFINGLNISPASSTYNLTTRKWTSAFRTSDIKGTKIFEVDTEATYVPYYEKKIITTQNVVIGPNGNIDSDFEFDVFEITPATTSTQGQMNIMNPSNYTYTIDGNIVKFVFVAGKVGKEIVVCERRYNQVINESYSYDGLIQKLPTWVSFLPKEKMFVFLNGRLLERDRFYLFDPFRYTVVKGDTVIATDLDTNTIEGELFNAYFTSEMELVEYNVSLNNGDKIITLNNKDFPFSKKYNLVFVDGKLIHPDNIKEIDNYRFSMITTSTNNMCIFRKRMEIPNKEKFSGIKDKWTEYLETLTQLQIEGLIGLLYPVQTGENSIRSVYLPERHMFEILYHYCLKGRDHLDPRDEDMIPIELPGTILEDGRIPISTMRSGPYPRYLL